MTATQNDNIFISLPANEEMTNIVRLATTAVANRAGFDLDQSDDLNTAMEEVFRYFCSSCAMGEADVKLTYHIQDDKLEIRAGETMNSLSANDTKIGRYCRFILDKVTDGFREDSESGRFTLIIEKQSKP